jgi:hypothetical protein
MSLQPTPVDPSKAALLGKEVVDVSKGLEGMALQIKEHQDWNETNKAELALSNSYDDNLTMVHSDEDIGTLKERLNRKNLSDLDSAAKLINSPDARNEFLAKAQLKQSMQNAHLDAVIHSRQIDEGKTTFLANSESNEKHFVHAANPDERELYRQEIIKNANYAASMGYISKAHAQRYLENIMPHLDIQTVSYDISINPQRAL